MMFETDSSNSIFKLAADFVNNTSRHVFLTGKAGTGKTTFLKYIKENTHKNVVVVAPTGVAAINAGGVTMHSFFQLPFGPYIPGTKSGFSIAGDDITDKHSLFTNIRFNSNKRDLLLELELLIIDEISMVRSDMLDAMDAILRHFRKKPHLPFGGVQVLFIGDMFQLPPVIANNEWEILQEYYESPFFFSAKVIAESPPLYIELKKIYRQNEQQFIDVLNKVRTNRLTQQDFDLLNSRYIPEFIPNKEDKYITLSTHNKKADAINYEQLSKLKGKSYLFSGSVKGDFSEKALPTEMELQLKEGAQIMFIKNDSGSERRYFNGKLATIKSIKDNEIIVITDQENEELKVEKETWRNIRYSFHKETDSIKEEELGSFIQYPIRLAWAITIHKSQGLTFEKAIIDAGGSFAAGQVYVALSRCTSLSGMVLLSMLYPSAISTDRRVIAFAQKETAAETLEALLKKEQKQYQGTLLINQFSWKKILENMVAFTELVPGKKLPNPSLAMDLSARMLSKAGEQAAIAEKFQLQLEQILLNINQSGEASLLVERTQKAIVYFVNTIGKELLMPLEAHINGLKHASKVKKYVLELEDIAGFLRIQMQKLASARFGELPLCSDPEHTKQIDAWFKKPSSGKAIPIKGKSVKGSSLADSLALFESGKNISEIAAIRQLTESTIAGHLSFHVRTGKLGIHQLISADRLNKILPVVTEMGGVSIGPIKERLSNDCSFIEIRFVISYWQWLEEQKVNS
jgi:hypothetical protein